MNNSNTKILVTGGAGFIGYHLTKALVEKGYKVRVLDNLCRNVNHVDDLWKEGKIEFLKGDLREKMHVLQAMKGVDYVFHQAAVCLNRCNAFPKEAMEVNLEGTLVTGSNSNENKKISLVADSMGKVGTLDITVDGSTTILTEPSAGINLSENNKIQNTIRTRTD